ncbi:unconventional prefoldin RPB5 interactor-like, partial [Pollicipes pollicipes]
MAEQDKKLSACEDGLRQWRRYSDDYRALRQRLASLPDKLSHEVTVPLGPLAFAPGRLVHTNELLVLLGDNWFCKTSASAACGIVDRRLEHCDKTLSSLEKERDLFAGWRQQAAGLQEAAVGDVREITEPLDEEAELQWR